jgi:hypothetical protein
VCAELVWSPSGVPECRRPRGSGRRWEAGTDADPMITTSVRLPKSLLGWVRRSAATQHVRPSVLIRQWIEQHRDAAEAEGTGDLAARVERLERVVFRDTRAS